MFNIVSRHNRWLFIIRFFIKILTQKQYIIFIQTCKRIVKIKSIQVKSRQIKYHIWPRFHLIWLRIVMYIERNKWVVNISDLNIAKIAALQYSNKRVENIFSVKIGVEADNLEKLWNNPTSYILIIMINWSIYCYSCKYYLLITQIGMDLKIIINRGNRCDIRFQPHHKFSKVLGLLRSNRMIPSSVKDE